MLTFNIDYSLHRCKNKEFFMKYYLFKLNKNVFKRIKIKYNNK